MAQRAGSTMHKRYSTVIAAMALAALAACSSSNSNDPGGAQAGNVPNPTVTPVTGGYGRAIDGLRFDVEQYGYEEREYFFEGTAITYPPSTQPPAQYRSRMIVWTPRDPAHFNGTTVVEWAHVSVGAFELNAELVIQASMLVDRGFAFALVSAHEAGICGSGGSGVCDPSSLRMLDPDRYGSLMHPGEDYGFDIFNQALQAIKYPSGTAPLGGLNTRFIIAEGFQPTGNRSVPIPDPDAGRPPYGSAGPLNGYIKSPASEVGLADAFLLDSAGPVVEPEEYPGLVLHHLDETAIQRVAPPNRPNHITWEVTGSPHVDRWGADNIVRPAPGEPPRLLSREEEEVRRRAYDNYGQLPDEGASACLPTRTLGTLYPRRYTLNAALVALREWLETGVAPATPPFLERVGPPPVSATDKLVRDSDGNAIGGLRSPIIEVPVAAYDGEGCVVGGTSTQFSAERLAELYPTHRSYVEQLLAATNKAVDDGTLLCEDAQTIMRGASESPIGGADAFTAVPDCAL